MRATDSFTHMAKWTAHASGHPTTFSMALAIIVIWAATGPLFQYSDTWQLAINTGTTIVTFLMVFLIQNTQNRDAIAMQIKLDELIRAMRGAHNTLVDLEDMTEEELERVRAHYVKLAESARAKLTRGRRDTGSPEMPEDR
jgi:low affinity Fe/Cu permease